VKVDVVTRKNVIPHPYDVLVYERDGNYYARDREGKIICENSQTSCIKEAIYYVRSKAVNFGEGGIVKIGKGSYRINEPITFPYGSLFITIKGSKGTVLVPHGNISVFNFRVDQDGEAIRYVDIENLYVAGDVNNKTATVFNFDVYDGDGILRYIALINVRNVVVHGVKRFMYAKNLWMAKFTDVEIQYSGVDVPLIFLDRSAVNTTHDIYFTRAYIEDIRGSQAILYARQPTFNVTFTNSYIESYRNVPYLLYFENWSGGNIISDCLLDGASAYAIRVGINNIIKNNKIANSQGGINIGWHFNIVTGNIIAVDDIGVRGSGGHSLVVANNYITNSNVGIYFDWGSYYSVIANNVIRDVRLRGIFVYHSEHVKIVNNQIHIEGTVAQDAIRIRDPGYNIVMGNTVRGSLTNSIVEENSDYNTIVNNIVEMPMIIVGPNTVVRNNRGFATERSGVATIPAGSTSTTVNHGLVCIPSKVLITPLGQLTGQIWVEDRTSTSFTIRMSNPSPANLNVAWYAEC